jgi:hypothetical protein
MCGRQRHAAAHRHRRQWRAWRPAAIVGNSTNEKQWNVDNTIVGDGTIGGANLTLTNDGVIKASGSGTTLEIKPNIARTLNVLTGNLQIDDGATLKLDGSTPETINFLTDTNQNQGTLYLNDTANGGQGATNTVNTTTFTNVNNNTAGTFEITGPGDVTANSGSGIRFVTDTSGNVNITVDGSGNVTGGGSGSSGIFVQLTSMSDNGSITVNQTGTISGSQHGIFTQTQGNGAISITTSRDVTVTTGGSSTSGKDFSGILADSFGTGSLRVTTATNHTVDSSKGGSGILAVNEDTVGSGSSIMVTANGTIHSGSANTAGGTQPAGISAGYNSGASGTVTVTSYATITAEEGPGILAFMSGGGTGDVYVYDEDPAQITTKADASPTSNTNKAPYGIFASNSGTGSVYVTTYGNNQITSESSGIVAANSASAIPDSRASIINVIANTSPGTLNNNSGAVRRILGFWGGTGSSQNTPNDQVCGSITIDTRDITADAETGSAPERWCVGCYRHRRSKRPSRPTRRNVGQYGIDGKLNPASP